jgi:hypothetical protein
MFLKTLGRFDVAQVYDLEKGIFLNVYNGKLHGDDGRGFFYIKEHCI